MLWILLFAGLYAAAALLLALFQDALVFRVPHRGDRPLPDAPDLERGELERDGGARFRIVTARHPAPRAVAVWFVGTAGDLQNAARGAIVLRAYGMEVIGVEHPGYGTSAGPTTVATVLAAAEAAGRHARERARALGVPFVAAGSSLGTFAAVHVAATIGCDRLLLKAPPTSMVDAAKARFWWLPVRLLLRHPFDNHGKAVVVRCPVLVLHGDRDTVVPPRLGRALAAAFAPPAEYVVAAGYGHRGIPFDRDGPFGDRIAAFLGLDDALPGTRRAAAGA